MAWFGRSSDDTTASAPALVVEGLDVHYGRAHALQGVSLTLERGVLGIVGRNGMGKTTLCNALTGLVPARGSVRLFGEEVLGLAPNQITRRGMAYVPQGRRVWPSLTVDETLRLVAPKRAGRDVERIYTMFPRLAERRANGGAQLSGGEQQMLAIGRALLLQPRLLVMDEPTEGLAPVIVEQVEARAAPAGRRRPHRGAADRTEPGCGDRGGRPRGGDGQRPHRAGAAGGDAGRRRGDLQERLLGVRSGGGHDVHADDDAADAAEAAAEPIPPPPEDDTVQVYTVRRAHGDGGPSMDDGTAHRARLQPLERRRCGGADGRHRA